MSINKVTVEISPMPGFGGGIKQLRIVTVADGRRFEVVEQFYPDEFQSLFRFLIENAATEIERMVKNKEPKQ